jgi:hypothetical protein
MVQEGKDLVRIQGVSGEVDDGSGQAFGHREIPGLEPPAVQTGLNWMPDEQNQSPRGTRAFSAAAWKVGRSLTRRGYFRKLWLGKSFRGTWFLPFPSRKSV